MDFIKKNYEKILLALVLLGLMGAVVFLLIYIPQTRDELASKRIQLLNPSVKTLNQVYPDLFKLDALDGSLKRADTVRRLDFTTKHNLLNPVRWVRSPDGTLHKLETGNEIGPGALQVTDIKKLYLRVEYDNAGPNGTYVKVTHEAALRPRDRETINSLISPEGASGIFKVVSGSPVQAGEITLQFKDPKEPQELLTISPTKPFERLAGYTADLKYPPDPASGPWLSQRLGANLNFDGAAYKIVDIQENYVVISSILNNKKTTIYLHSANESH